MPPLRYSDRKQLHETGRLGDLTHDRVPDELALAIRVIVESASADVATLFVPRLNSALMEHFGVGDRWTSFYAGGDNADAFLDAVEILAEQATTNVFVPLMGGKGKNRVPIPDIEERINRAFERFRFGYRLEQGEVRKVGSPLLDEQVMAPTLLAVRRAGWEEVERSYHEALAHQRGGEADDALTAASAAIEAALKAVGMQGSTLKQLMQSFKASGLVPGYLTNIPELLVDLVDRLHAARNTQGDAHGKAPGAPDVPQPLADLAIYWAGAFIAYLAATAP